MTDAELQAFEMRITECRKATVMLVESTSYETLAIWREWASGSPGGGLRPVKWEQMKSEMRTIGTIGEMPVAVQIDYVRIDGKMVGFYEATSQVVDHRMVDAWLTSIFPGVKRTDATNFAPP